MKRNLILYNDHALPDDPRYSAKNAMIESPTGKTISYRQLSQCIDKLAVAMKTKLGLNDGDMIVVLSHRKIEDVIIFYAALAIGVTYVPTDPKQGKDKLAALFERVEPKVIFDTEAGENTVRVKYSDGEVYIDGERLDDIGDVEIIRRPGDPKSAAYIIYTSGSGGQPKGVQINREGPKLFAEHLATYGFHNDETVYLSVCPFYFDATITDLFVILPLHGQLILTGDVVFPADILEPMEKYRVTDGLWVPSMFKIMLSRFSDIGQRDLSAVKMIWFGGEYCSYPLWRSLADKIPGIKYVNGYGPTENVHTCMILHFDESFDFSEYTDIPLGQPIHGSRIFVVNENMQPVQRGETGELYVESPTLMMGYHKDPERSKRVMVQLPHLSEKTLYKTGDLVLYSERGDYYFRGRIDDLVKVGGILVSLNEIEKLIINSNMVEECVLSEVTLPSSTGNALVAFIRPSPRFQQQELMHHLRNHLEPRKIPRYFELSDDVFPMTRNGKVNRKQLTEEFIQKHTQVPSS